MPSIILDHLGGDLQAASSGPGRPDRMGRRPAGILCFPVIAAVAMSLAGYSAADVYVGAVSIFFLFLLIQSFFGNGNSAIVFSSMAAMWPLLLPLRASGFGLVYGISNRGKFIGPAGLSVIIGASNFVTPQATLSGIVPGFNYFAIWYVLALLTYLLIGGSRRAGARIERSTRTIARP